MNKLTDHVSEGYCNAAAAAVATVSVFDRFQPAVNPYYHLSCGWGSLRAVYLAHVATSCEYNSVDISSLSYALTTATDRGIVFG